jgi:hypothetical protein
MVFGPLGVIVAMNDAKPSSLDVTARGQMLCANCHKR